MRVIDYDPLPRFSDGMLSRLLAETFNLEGQRVELSGLIGSGPEALWQSLQGIAPKSIAQGLRSGRWKQLFARPTGVSWKRSGRVLRRNDGGMLISFSWDLVGVKQDGTVPIMSPRVNLQLPRGPQERTIRLDSLVMRPYERTLLLRSLRP